MCALKILLVTYLLTLSDQMNNADTKILVPVCTKTPLAIRQINVNATNISVRQSYASLMINFLISFYTVNIMFYTVYLLIVQTLIIILDQGVIILC